MQFLTVNFKHGTASCDHIYTSKLWRLLIPVGYVLNLKTRGLCIVSIAFVCMCQTKQWGTIVQGAFKKMYLKRDISSMTVRHKRSEINNNFRSANLKPAHRSIIAELQSFLQSRSKCNEVLDSPQKCKRYKIDPTLMLTQKPSP